MDYFDDVFTTFMGLEKGRFLHLILTKRDVTPRQAIKGIFSMLIWVFVLISRDGVQYSILETVSIPLLRRGWNSNTKYGNDNIRYCLCALFNVKSV